MSQVRGSTWQHTVFRKTQFSVAFYFLQLYGLKDFVTVIVYIIAIALEKFEIHIFSRYY